MSAEDIRRGPAHRARGARRAASLAASRAARRGRRGSSSPNNAVSRSGSSFILPFGVCVCFVGERAPPPNDGMPRSSAVSIASLSAPLPAPSARRPLGSPWSWSWSWSSSEMPVRPSSSMGPRFDAARVQLHRVDACALGDALEPEARDPALHL